MELKGNNIKFTNSERKLINNTHPSAENLPGFADGGIADLYGGYRQSKQFNPNAQRPLDMPVAGTQDFAGVKTSAQRVLNSVKPGGDIDNLKTPVGEIAKGIKIGNIQTAVAAIPGLIGSMHNSWNNYDSVEDIEALARPTSAITNGVGWTKMMMAKDGKLPKYAGGALGNVLGATASGATVGSALGPVGAIAGGAAGLFGSILGEASSVNKQRENKRIAEANIAMGNNARQNEAIGKGMLLYTAQRYGDQYDQSLFGHANGKLPKYNDGNLPPYAFTEYGLMLGLKPNAMGAPGETMTDGNGNDLVLPGKPSNNDVLPIYASGKTTIVTNKKGLSKYYQKTGDLAGVQNAMAYYKLHGYKNGKMPGFAEGWLGNAIPFGLGSIASLAQYIDAKNSTPYRPNTYASNPYETRGLTTLAGLRINPYPITQQLRNAEARTNRAIDIAGGLSGSQRTAARLANLNTTLNNISKLLSDIQQQNNAYRANYAQAAINAGQASRQARMQANQWDLDMYAKAHAARNRGIQTGIANMLSQIQQYQANEFKRRQFNDTMDLYRDDMDLRNRNMQWYQNWYGKRGLGLDPLWDDKIRPLT